MVELQGQRLWKGDTWHAANSYRVHKCVLSPMAFLKCHWSLLLSDVCGMDCFSLFKKVEDLNDKKHILK